MPLYEYECLDCGERFEALVRHSSVPACPGCQSSRLNQLISLFAADTEGVRQSNLQTARRKNSKMARDKAIADHEATLDHH